MNVLKIYLTFKRLSSLALIWSFISPSIAYSDQLSLPAQDLIAPEVAHEVMSEQINAGTNVQLKAHVTDNVGVKAVTLFYRTKGGTSYNRANMDRVGETDDYVATLYKDEVVEPGIEYYIQAVDFAGNELLHGYSFSPLVVSVAPTSGTSDKAMLAGIGSSSTASEETRSSKKTWIWVGVGVVAAAILASKKSDSDTPTGKPTGTVVVTAPSP